MTALLPGQIYDADDQCYIAQGIPSCGDVSFYLGYYQVFALSKNYIVEGLPEGN